MSTWGYIALGIGIGILLVPILAKIIWKILLWGLKRKLGSLLEGLSELGGGAAPPLRIRLTPFSEPMDWATADGASSKDKDLKSLGFAPTGDFMVEELGEVFLKSYLSDCGTVSAFLCKHPARPDCFLDLVRVFDDGTSITVSDAESEGLEICPQHPSVKLTHQAPSALLDELKKQWAEKTPAKVEKDEIGKLYETGYATIMDWRVEKGGVTLEEMMTKSEKPMSPEEQEDALEMFRQQHLAQVQELLQIRHAEQTQMPIPTWEEVRYSLLYVHDFLTVDDVRSEMESAVYWLDREFPFPSTPGRAGFAQMVNHLPPAVEVKLIDKVSGGIEADVYRLPEPPDDCDT